MSAIVKLASRWERMMEASPDLAFTNVASKNTDASSVRILYVRSPDLAGNYSPYCIRIANSVVLDSFHRSGKRERDGTMRKDRREDERDSDSCFRWMG